LTVENHEGGGEKEMLEGGETRGRKSIRKTSLEKTLLKNHWRSTNQLREKTFTSLEPERGKR